MKKIKLIRISTRLPEDMVRDIDALARKKGLVCRSSAIRMAIDDYIYRLKKRKTNEKI